MLLLLAAAPVRAGEALDLRSAAGSHPLWPELRLLSDPEGRLDAAGALQRMPDFGTPPGPGANLGIRRDVVWLTLVTRVADGDGRWVLDLDYPPFNELDVFVVVDGRVGAPYRLGSVLPFETRPMHVRTHAVELQLPVDREVRLLLRLRSDSAMVLPFTLSTPDAYHRRESGRLVAQGLIFGLSGALLVYSLFNAAFLRNRLFGAYALLLLGTTAFFVDFSGIGQQFLWPVRSGMVAMLSPLSVLLALAAGGPFVASALDTETHLPRLHRVILGLSALAAAGLAAGLAGLLDYRQAQALATLVGPTIPVLVIPAAFQRARRGDRIGTYMLLGWSFYVFGAASTVGLLRGWLPANVWTLHLYQCASLLEMLAWFRVLGLRIEAVRRDAQQQAALVDDLSSQARTDALTGLPNRRGLEAAMATAVAAAAPNRMLAVLMIDLDGFKAVNDRLGHEAGDRLLVEVARRLKGPLRHGDVVARLGGDEFVVLAQALRDETQARAVAQKLLDTLVTPVIVAETPCPVGMTIGYAVSPLDGDDGAALLRRADEALYEGKRAGRRQARRAQPVAALA